MIFQRIAKALRDQDWTVFFIEFVLVVAGVLVALEVDRYNESLKERAEELDFLVALERDVQRDINDLQRVLQTVKSVESFGRSAYSTLGAQGCRTGECWLEIVELFHASQWLDVSLNKATYEEMKRLGLPEDSQLKDRLEQYYATGEARKILTRDLPEYRELVRSIVPPTMQQYIWSNCFTISGRVETYNIDDCASPTTESSARMVIEQLQRTPQVMKALTFWLSNLSATSLTLPQQIDAAEQLKQLIHSNVKG